MTGEPQQERLIEHLLADAAKRHQYQHEFSLAGFKTLILLNGGAIIALLTYLGHGQNMHPGAHLSSAFVSYIVGLVTVVLAYLAAYFSQGSFLDAASVRAWLRLGLDVSEQKPPAHHERAGYIAIAFGVVLCVASLTAFIIGSWCAMKALT